MPLRPDVPLPVVHPEPVPDVGVQKPVEREHLAVQRLRFGLGSADDGGEVQRLLPRLGGVSVAWNKRIGKKKVSSIVVITKKAGKYWWEREEEKKKGALA